MPIWSTPASRRRLVEVCTPPMLRCVFRELAVALLFGGAGFVHCEPLF